MPARLKSISEWSAPWMRPVAPPTCRFLPVSSSRCTRSISTRYVYPPNAGPRGPDVQVLAGVLLEVHPLDLDAVRLAVDLDVEVPGDAERLVVLAGLEALGDVRVEVVLPREAAPGGDPAAQRQPDADRRLDRRGVGDRQRAG